METNTIFQSARAFHHSRSLNQVITKLWDNYTPLFLFQLYLYLLVSFCSKTLLNTYRVLDRINSRLKIARSMKLVVTKLIFLVNLLRIFFTFATILLCLPFSSIEKIFFFFKSSCFKDSSKNCTLSISIFISIYLSIQISTDLYLHLYLYLYLYTSSHK